MHAISNQSFVKQLSQQENQHPNCEYNHTLYLFLAVEMRKIHT